MPETNSKSANGWIDWSKYVLRTLEKHEGADEQTSEEIASLKTAVAVIESRCKQREQLYPARGINVESEGEKAGRELVKAAMDNQTKITMAVIAILSSLAGVAATEILPRILGAK